MIMTYSDAYKKYKNDYGINKAMMNNELFKVAKGMYSDKKNIDLIAVYSKKYPNAIITLDSAFYYYKLTDNIPTKVNMAIARHARPIKDDDIIVSYIDDEIVDYGKTEVLVDDEKVNIYDKERLLVELIRKKNQMPFDYYKELISNYRKISDELDMAKIEKYMALFKNEVNIGNSLLREVF
ncbi:MAG: hypothetical protein IJ568_01300 [Bacilli bacterium]|nr:hypothetical protein [Bacilli bacterium]